MLATNSQRQRTQVFTPAPPSVAYERILRIQGYSDFSRVRRAIVVAAKEMAEASARLASPRVAYTRIAIAALDSTSLRLVNGIRFHCNAFASTLANCTEVAVFVLSLRAGIDERVVELTCAGDLLEALLLETAGWLCIEDATRQFKVHLRSEVAAESRRITSRMGPGYGYRVSGEACNWPLEQQAALFSVFGGAELPAKVSSSNAMLPKMSRSGLFGVAPIARKSRTVPLGLDELAVSAV